MCRVEPGLERVELRLNRLHRRISSSGQEMAAGRSGATAKAIDAPARRKPAALRVELGGLPAALRR